MIKDKSLNFSEAQDITVTANSTNIVDLGLDNARVQPLNEKGLIELFVQAIEVFAGGTSVVVTLQSDDDSAFGSPTTVVVSGTVLTAALVAGYQFKLGKLPRISERYLRLAYTVDGTYTTGQLDATLLLDGQTNNA